MQFTTGTVIDGKIIVTGATMLEGAVVAVILPGNDESFSLSSDQEDELLDAMAETEQGEFVTLENLLATLPTH